MSIALTGIDPPMRLCPAPALSVEEFWRFSSENPNFRMERTSGGEILIMSPTRRRSGFRNSQITQLAWLIDPKRKAVEIYRLGQEPEVQEGSSAVHGEGPVAGFVLELGHIWS